jgi:MYXO-CTERM domain-containing protein
MINIRRAVRRASLLLGLILLSASASASIVYTYVGNNFTLASGVFTTSDHITFSFTLDNPVVTSPSVGVAPTAWSFNAGPLTFGSATAGATLELFVYTTAAGLPSGVCINGLYTQASGTSRLSASLATSNGALLVQTVCASTTNVQESVGIFPSNQDPFSFAAVDGMGSWSMREVTAVNAIPEPAPLALGALGLLALALLRRQRA